jgi:hypothetical protein
LSTEAEVLETIQVLAVGIFMPTARVPARAVGDPLRSFSTFARMHCEPPACLRSGQVLPPQDALRAHTIALHVAAPPPPTATGDSTSRLLTPTPLYFAPGVCLQCSRGAPEFISSPLFYYAVSIYNIQPPYRHRRLNHARRRPPGPGVCVCPWVATAIQGYSEVNSQH